MGETSHGNEQKQDMPAGAAAAVGWAIAAAVLIAAVVTWMFVMTGDIRFLFFIPVLILLPLWVLVLVLVWRDAKQQGMHAALWTLLVAVSLFIGLAIYLIVREMRPVLRARRLD